MLRSSCTSTRKRYRDRYDRKQRWTARYGGFYAASGVHIHWSSEVRMYSMATCFTVASSWLLLRSISGMALKSWIAYTISATLLLYTHNYSVFVICGQMFFLAADLRRAWKAETKNSHRVGQQRNMRLDRSLYSSMVVFLVVFLSFARGLLYFCDRFGRHSLVIGFLKWTG